MAKPARVIILGDAKDAAKAFKMVRDEADQTENRLTKVGDGMTKVGQGMTLGVTLPLVALGKASVDAAREAEESTARMESSFESMGASAWTSMEQLKEQANTLGNELTTVGDEAVLETQARMLTFGNITGEVFDRSIMSAIDLGEKMGTDAADAAMQLGKAINNPVEGISALTRVGITFSDAQKEQIRLFQEQGDLASAQGIILEELERQFGGTAEAMANTASGEMKQAMNQLGESAEAAGAVLLPILADLAGKAADLAGWFSELDPATQKVVVGFAGAAAAAGPLLIVTGKLVTAVGQLKESNLSLGRALGSPLTGPLIIATGLAVGFASVIKQNVDRTNEWRDAMTAATDEIEPMIDEIIAAGIVHKELDESMAEAGVTAGDLKEAITGDSEAFQDFVSKLGPGQRDLMTWVEAQRIARVRADEFAQSEREVDAVTSQLANKMPTFAGAMQGYTQATGDATGSTEDLDDATQNLADTQRALIDPLFNLRSKTLALRDAQQDYNTALVEHGPKSQEAEDAAFELAEAQLAANSAAATYASEGGPESVEALADILREAGLVEDSIRLIIESIHDLNSTKVTNPITRGGGGGTQVFDTGGVVQGPRGSPQLVLAHAGETILPTHKAGASGVLGSQVVVHVSGHVLTERDLLAFIVDGLTRARRRGVAV